MDKTILVTYFDGKKFCYDWLENDEEAKEWIEENKDECSKIDMIEVAVLRTIYQSEDDECDIKMIHEINLKGVLDKKICDVESDSDNVKTYREFIIESEGYFELESRDVDNMSEIQLRDYLDYIDELWNK